VQASVSVDIDAPPERVWAVMCDAEAWPQWTASVSDVRRLDTGHFDIGSRVRIKQPKFPPAVWTVESIEPGRTFTWVAGGPGFRNVATHSVEATATGSRATLSIDQHGVIGELFARLTADITRRYLDLEAAGLKRRSEEEQPEGA
jgi:uncharacterized protein YndB with AHSA1/START domain